MNSILVLRLSSMGDVLLTLPVMKGLLNDNKDLSLIFVTRLKFAAWFEGIERLTVIPFEPDGRHKGFPGLLRLHREISKHSFGKVADLHGILRTWLLDGLFLFSGRQVFRIRKYRKIRRDIIRRRNAGGRVPTAVDRYLEVFRKAGIEGHISADPPFGMTTIKPIDKSAEVKKIGIAPLSRHITKNWGLKNTGDLIDLILMNYLADIHLFGGPEDKSALESLVKPGVFNHAGSPGVADEINLIASMDIFVSMDSANMHLASLAGVPVISVWGATDPSMGFAPLYQPETNAVYADPSQVTCRPCSVFGEIPCRRTDHPMICMNSIKPNDVLNKISNILHLADKK